MKIPKSEDRIKTKHFTSQKLNNWGGWDALKKEVEAYMTKHSLKPNQTHINVDVCEDGYGDITTELTVDGSRMETEEEKEARIKELMAWRAQQKAQKEAKEKETWEAIKPHIKRLAKKYGE